MKLNVPLPVPDATSSAGAARPDLTRWGAGPEGQMT